MCIRDSSLVVEVRSDERGHNANNPAGIKKYGYSLKPVRAFAVAIWLAIQPPSALQYNEYFIPEQ
eukprot:9897120-Prorocentrum_lima.AAC.1